MNIQVLDPATGRLVTEIHGAAGQKHNVAGLSMLWQGTSLAARDISLLSCTQAGLVRMHAPKDPVSASAIGEMPILLCVVIIYQEASHGLQSVDIS